MAEWDRQRAGGRTVGPGLLVTLVRQGVGASPASPLLTYAEMLAACDRDGKRTSDYEAVPVEGEAKPLWRQCASGPASREETP